MIEGKIHCFMQYAQETLKYTIGSTVVNAYKDQTRKPGQPAQISSKLGESRTTKDRHWSMFYVLPEKTRK